MSKTYEQTESVQSVTGLWTKTPRCQARSQKNDKICSSTQMAHKKTIPYQGDVQEGILNQTTRQILMEGLAAKHDARFHSVDSKQMRRSHSGDVITTAQWDALPQG